MQLSTARLVLAIGIVTMMTLLTSTASAQPQSLLGDDRSWQPIASDGVKINVTRETSSGGKPALRIDFDFTSGAGFGGAFLDGPIDLPENYDLTFHVRGQGPANNLELKLVDESKLNVWWINRRAFEWPTEPMRLANQRRHFHFAWGPSGGKPIAKLGRLEVIIAAAEGGKGTVWLEDFNFTPLPPPQPYTGKPQVTASSATTSATEMVKMLGENGPTWVAADDDAAPMLTIDFAQPRDVGGILVHQPADHVSANFTIDGSDDGNTWMTLRRVKGATALPSEIILPDVQTRWLRVAFERQSGGAAPGVSRVQILDAAAGASVNAFWKLRAARASRGLYPRNLLNEQSFWTVMGQPGDDREALINEEGQIEVAARGFSLEPFIVQGGKLLTWADGSHEQSLRDGWAPMPTVVRMHKGAELRITAFAAGEAGASNLHAAYTLRNTSDAPIKGKLVVAVRPMQVLPPWQDLNITGGWTAIRSIRVEKDGLLVNESKDPKRIIPSAGCTVLATAYDGGDPVEHLAAGNWPTGAAAVEDPQKSASALLAWDYELAPGKAATVWVAVPFHGFDVPANLPTNAAQFTELADKVAGDWAAQVNRVKFTLPAAAKQFHDTIRATQAYILINHDGKGFQPGSRTYDRSWMRDGSMTSAAMLELGHDELVRNFIDWIAPYQFESGKVPCVVDRRGPDPVPEHDSHGQLIWLIANTYRYTHDSELVRRHFPRVKKAMEYIQSIRAERLTDEFSAAGKPRQEPGKPPVPALAFRGLVPESISHEGYAAKPMHSFWDTFFILRGLSDAAYLADVAGEPALAIEWRALTNEFRQSLIDSIRLAHQAHGIDYLPGCVELGDFDSTSSTILLWPVDEASNFPREWVDATFDRAWSEFVNRRDTQPAKWDAYTPYELRHVGSYVRLGHKDRAWAAMNYFFAHQRPQGWRHWAEVVWREPATPRMIGDMPHTWCGSDFLNAMRSMFVYEDQHQEKLILLAGLPDAWLADPTGVAFSGLRSEYGVISVSVRPNGADRLLVRIDGEARPKGGIELRSPLSKKIRSAKIDGQAAEVSGNRLTIIKLPAVVELEY